MFCARVAVCLLQVGEPIDLVEGAIRRALVAKDEERRRKNRLAGRDSDDDDDETNPSPPKLPARPHAMPSTMPPFGHQEEDMRRVREAMMLTKQTFIGVPL